MSDLERTMPQGAPIAAGNAMIITLFDGERPPAEIDLRAFGKARVTFGRGEENDIRLTSPLVSRSHGAFDLSGGCCVIEDAESRNGLNLRGAPVSRQRLADGDAVRIDDALDPAGNGALLLFSTNRSRTGWTSLSLEGRRAVSIGRDTSCDIFLSHVSVSRLHARIEHAGDAGWILSDSNSANGVCVNGHTVGKAYALRDKDQILIVNTRLVFTARAIFYCAYATGIGVEAIRLGKAVPMRGGERRILSDVSLRVEPSEFVAIIGGSGAGKTTLLNCVSGQDRASNGSVRINGEELYESFDILRGVIGYVPQKDIVHDGLTLHTMLTYAAKLRMPPDTEKEERGARVREVIEAVGLAGREDTMIRSLSGGQKKRASIAVELLADPGLFFLDEPSSGLDPGTERSLMELLRRISRAGRTVVMVTHTTQNLSLCDKLVILGREGKLCFCGAPGDALAFFGAEDFSDIYVLLDSQTPRWSAAFAASRQKDAANTPPSVPGPRKRGCHSGRPLLNQLGILCGRYARLILGDRRRLAILLLQAPLLALLISFVANGREFAEYEATKSILFALSCAALWIGILNSIQDICNERALLRREAMSGLRPLAYVLSKFLMQGLICFVQALLLSGVFVALVGLPGQKLILPPFAELAATAFLTAFAAAGMGLAVSSVFKSGDGAMTAAPLLLLPQMLFSGILFEISGLVDAVSLIVPCRWSMEAFGAAANLNALPSRLAMEGLPIAREAESFFIHTAAHLWEAWGALLLFVPVCALACYAALRRIGRP